MKKSTNLQLYNPNRETLITKEPRDSIQNAVAAAIHSGKDIDIVQQRSFEITPNIGLKMSNEGAFVGIGITIKHVTINTYNMKG